VSVSPIVRCIIKYDRSFATTFLDEFLAPVLGEALASPLLLPRSLDQLREAYHTIPYSFNKSGVKTHSTS